MTYRIALPPIPAEGPLLRVSLTAKAAHPGPFDAEIAAAQAQDQSRAAKAAKERQTAKERGALLEGYYRIQDPLLRTAFLKKNRTALFAANR